MTQNLTEHIAPPQTPLKIMFGVEGRITRKTFIIYMLLAAPLTLFIVGLYPFFLTLPAKRIRDTGHSPFWLILLLAPPMPFVLLYLITADGDKGANEYGDDPKHRETPGYYGFTDLMRAAKDGNLKHLTALIETGVDVNAQDIYGATALMYAVLASQLQIVSKLMEHGACPTLATKSGLTPEKVAININNKKTGIEILSQLRKSNP
jgi:uncharacterized membrane protein YhaH (DUF805 family)